MNQLKVRALVPAFLFPILVAVLAGCGSSRGGSTQDAPPTNTPLSDGAVIKSRAVFALSSTAANGELSTLGASTAIPVSVVTSANTKVTFDTTAFKVPAITSDVLDFGLIKVTSLQDNDLSVCGSAGTSACSTAFIRIYTTGVAGAGLWNAAAGYGAPINANFNSASKGVGLGAANAAIVQTYTIDTKTHVLHLSAFTPAPNYDITIDFTNAGVGSYSTNLVVEYGLQ